MRCSVLVATLMVLAHHSCAAPSPDASLTNYLPPADGPYPPPQWWQPTTTTGGWTGGGRGVWNTQPRWQPTTTTGGWTGGDRGVWNTQPRWQPTTTTGGWTGGDRGVWNSQHQWRQPINLYGPQVTDYGTGGTVVKKHIYVHVAPKEEEYHRPAQIIHTRQAQKHYKIVFIKAPSPPTPAVPIIPHVAQDEQKTLIYVLVKRPEDGPQITIPEVAPTKPSKPEVYFIKYKTQKEIVTEKPTEKYGVLPPVIYEPPTNKYGVY